MNKPLLLLGSLLLLCSASVVGGTRVVAVAGHTPGANGTHWTTDLALTNHTSSVASVELIFHADDDKAYTRRVTVGANQSLLVQDAVNPFFFSGAGRSDWLGQLEIQSSADISATAHIQNSGAAAGTFGSTYASFDPTVLALHGSITGLRSSTHFRSNVAFANAGPVEAAVYYNTRRADGSFTATRQLAVKPLTTVQIPVGPDLPADDEACLLEWSSNVPLYAVGSVIDNSSGDPMAISSITGGRNRLSFPLVGKSNGALGTYWTTGLSISSTSGSSGSATLIYEAGTNGTYTASIPLPPHGSFRTDDVNALLGAPLGAGSLRVSTTVRAVAVARVFNTQIDGTTFGSAMLPQEATVRAPRLRFGGVRRDSAFRLNVAIANDNDFAVDGSIVLYDQRGARSETEIFHAGAHSAVQLPMNRGEDVLAGEVEVTTKKDAFVTMLASNVDNVSGDTLLVEPEQENERQSELDTRISPATPVSGSPTSFTLLAGGANVHDVKWDFGDGNSATGPNSTHTFSSPGDYLFSVEVTMPGGAIVHEREKIHVSLPANANALDFTWSPFSITAGAPITLSVLTETTLGGSYVWNLPGGIARTGSTISHAFPADGVYEVELVLLREGAILRKITHTLRVGTGGGGSMASAVSFTTTPAVPKAGDTVSFSATFDDPPAPGSLVRWRFENDARPEGLTVFQRFPAAGNYVVRVELDQPGRAPLEREKTITVTP